MHYHSGRQIVRLRRRVTAYNTLIVYNEYLGDQYADGSYLILKASIIV
jgi:hypothetical protein